MCIVRNSSFLAIVYVTIKFHSIYWANAPHIQTKHTHTCDRQASIVDVDMSATTAMTTTTTTKTITITWRCKRDADKISL